MKGRWMATSCKCKAAGAVGYSVAQGTHPRPTLVCPTLPPFFTRFLILTCTFPCARTAFCCFCCAIERLACYRPRMHSRDAMKYSHIEGGEPNGRDGKRPVLQWAPPVPRAPLALPGVRQEGGRQGKRRGGERLLLKPEEERQNCRGAEGSGWSGSMPTEGPQACGGSCQPDKPPRRG